MMKMRMKKSGRALLGSLMLLGLGSSANAATRTVSSLADSGVGTLLTDQHASGRPVNGRSDIGAYEFGSSVPEAPSLVVTTSSDNSTNTDGLTSLREAIAFANSNDDTSAITFSAAAFNSAKTITITSTLIVTENASITGPAARVTIDGVNKSFDIFRTNPMNGEVTASFEGLTVINGSAGIAVGNDWESSSNVNVTRCALSNNDRGLSVGTNSSATVTNCNVSANTGDGISLSKAKLTLTNSTVSGNGGHGIADYYGAKKVTNCNVSGNAGDGINSYQGGADVTNSTLSGNGGAGITDRFGGSTLINCTLSGNAVGISSSTATANNYVILTNSLVVGNTTNVQGVLLIPSSNSITTGTAAQAGLDPAGLQDNGGPTKTIALLPGGAAIDQAGADAPATDQRGQARPVDIPAIANATGGNGSDIGAFEFFRPSISVNNPRSLPEGSQSAPGSVTFDITLSGASTQNVTVNYQTVDGTNNPATAGSDYVAKSGKLTFAPGETLKRVTVFFIGDDIAERHETFFLDLTTPTQATIADARGVGTIRNDDGPSLSIADATIVDEGKSALTPQAFVVTLSQPSTITVTVDWSTANGTAGLNDYVAASGTLTFAPGETTKVIVVQLKGDQNIEPDETYKVNLSKPAFALISDSQGIGTIRNDDVEMLAFPDDEPSQ